ncbi:MAG: hypothetical protein QOJ80_580 [Mycobacterium sp.]|jgi:hypothetical protein|nr:hypothetical protein [Mycobacterium sp.]
MSQEKTRGDSRATGRRQSFGPPPNTMAGRTRVKCGQRAGARFGRNDACSVGGAKGNRRSLIRAQCFSDRRIPVVRETMPPLGRASDPASVVAPLGVVAAASAPTALARDTTPDRLELDPVDLRGRTFRWGVRVAPAEGRRETTLKVSKFLRSNILQTGFGRPGTGWPTVPRRDTKTETPRYARHLPARRLHGYMATSVLPAKGVAGPDRTGA